MLDVKSVRQGSVKEKLSALQKSLRSCLDVLDQASTMLSNPKPEAGAPRFMFLPGYRHRKSDSRETCGAPPPRRSQAVTAGPEARTV